MIRIPNEAGEKESYRLLDLKREELAALRDALLASMTAYPDYDHVLGCMYLLAMSFAEYGEMIWTYDPPYHRANSGTHGDEWSPWPELMDALNLGLAEPFDIQAVDLLCWILEKAREAKRYSPWVDRARAQLHKVDPNTYPLLKPRHLPENDEFGVPREAAKSLGLIGDPTALPALRKAR